MARGPVHLAHEAVLCGPQGLFARLISSWKGLLSIFWQIKRSKSKPSSVWFSRNQIWFAAKTFFFYLHLLLGTDTQNTGQSEHRFLYNKLAILWSWILVKLHLARNNFSPVNVARTSKKIGQPCSRTIRSPVTVVRISKILYRVNFITS